MVAAEAEGSQVEAVVKRMRLAGNPGDFCHTSRCTARQTLEFEPDPLAAGAFERHAGGDSRPSR